MKLTKKQLQEIIKEEYYNMIFEADDNPCWKGYEMIGMKDKGGKKVPNCVPISEEYDVVNYEDYQSFIPYLKELNEAEYQGRCVILG